MLYFWEVLPHVVLHFFIYVRYVSMNKFQFRYELVWAMTGKGMQCMRLRLLIATAFPMLNFQLNLVHYSSVIRT